jgi:hypothetical protein
LPYDASLLDETVASLAVGEFGAKQLNGDHAPDQGVESAGYSAARAEADHLQDFVTADLPQLRANVHGGTSFQKNLTYKDRG